MRHLLLASVVLFAGAHLAQAQTKDLPTLMTQRGKVVVGDDFAKTLTATKGPGKWDLVEGVLKVSELKDDMHGAVRRIPLQFTSGTVFQFDFKLDGAKMASVSINSAKGHTCRVKFNPEGFSVNKDRTNKKSDDKAETLAEKKIAIAPGQWHTMLIEIAGKEMLAQLDGKDVLVGSHDGIAVQNANFGLTVSGESASFRNLRVWQGTPHPNWNETRAKLINK